jgi:UDP-N-acetylmuramoylalanine--D-glutamate ligase
MHELAGKRVLIMGLGRFGGGVGAARFCAAKGAEVFVTDLLPEDQLRESKAKLAGLPIEFRLGSHDISDFAIADYVVVNPAIDARKNEYLKAAVAAGVKLTSEIELTIERLPDRGHTIGITGTAGKSTVTAMIGHALSETLGADRVHVGGNIGGSLLEKFKAIRADDWVVLELSSFMLEMLPGFSPHIAVVTNISDNHLDRHETMTAYTAAKQQLLRDQTAGDFALLGPGVADWRSATRGRVRIIEGDYAAPLLLPGRHNRFNAAAAAMACELAGVSRAKTEQALAGFRGLPHRLQMVQEHSGVRFYNDSKSTTPTSAVLAIESFEPGTVHVILGGYDKHADLREMAQRAARRCAGIYTIGQTGEAIAVAAQEAGSDRVVRCETLEKAVKQAVIDAKPGQVILLSPGCASWGQFENYEARGRAFAEAALRYTTEA